MTNCPTPSDQPIRRGSPTPRPDPTRAPGATRRDRQHVEILSAILAEHITRALGLAFEHIDEFGPDPLIIDMLYRAIARRQDPVLSAELASLAARDQSPDRI
jgi:hypothetical protein